MSPTAIQLRHIFRRLLRSPMFSAITLLTLALGIGANTAIFSVISGVLLKPLPYPHPESLVAVWQTAPGIGIPDLNASPSTYFTYREESRTFQDIAIWQRDAVSVTGLAEPEQLSAVAVSDGTLPLLGVQPTLGRWFTRQDDQPGSPATVILAYGYWQRRFGSDPSMVGRTIKIDGEPRQVIGVMPRSFRFLDFDPQVITPLKLNRGKSFIGNFSYQALARLKPGVTLAQANADVARMLPMMSQKFAPAPGLSMKMIEQAHIGPNVHPLKQDVVGDIGKVLWVLMGTVAMVLLIACANVANLLLVRAEGRQQELAIRAALGAGWARIAREFLLESVILGLIGGTLGTGLAYAAIRLLVALSPANLPRLDQISIDPQVLLFTFGLSLLAGLLFGLAPVLKYAGPHLGTTLREGGRGLSEGRDRRRARSVLVVVQVAVALVLLISSGLMIRTFQALRRVQPGLQRPDQILTLRISILHSQIPEDQRVLRAYNSMMAKIAALPGVEAVGLTNSVTMDGHTDNDPVFVEDRPGAEGQLPPIRRFKFLAPGWFHAMGNPLLAGRDLTWTDVYEMRPVVLVSENMARENWGTPAAALGKRVRENAKAPWHEIVGVTGNERDDGLNQKAPAIVYWPMAIKDFWGDPVNIYRSMSFTIRSARAGSAAFLKEVSQAIWSVDPEVPIAGVQTAQEILDKSIARTSFTLVMLAIAGGMALLLGIVGIYGVISYSVSQRTREIGIRMALGAPREEVRQMFVRHGLLLTVTGVACGALAAAALSRVMSSLLFEISPLDPVTYASVSVVLIAAASLASYVPAHRATGIDPSEALRAE